MFAVAFDLTAADTEQHHPKGVSQAYTDIGNALFTFGFERVQGSLYVTENENMANLFAALETLRAFDWFPPSVRDLRTFRLEQWSDFTPMMKRGNP